MRHLLLLPFLFAGFLTTANSQEQNAPKAPIQAGAPLSGRWVIIAEYLGTPINLSDGADRTGRQAHRQF